MFEDTRSILEPAGALAVAGVKAWCEQHRAQDRTYVAIACGANMNFDRLRFVAERAELGEEREAIFAVTIPERPGSFREFCALLGNRSVTEFNYRYADPKVAHLFVGVEVAGPQGDGASCSRCCASTASRPTTCPTTRWRSCTCATSSAGTRRPPSNEILYRFEFPERPGALMRFLDSMSAGWNISLFHYRNHGADYGRVLVGMQVPPSDKAEFQTFSRPSGLHLRGRIRQSGLSDVPRVAESPSSRRPPAALHCRAGGTSRARKIAGVLRFSLFRRSRADSGKLYALVSSLGPWQT